MARTNARRPKWASLDFDVDKWWDLLDEHEIDKTARHNLFMLAQMGDSGKYEALDLLTKLQHKAFKRELDDPNKWLHASTSKARMRLK